MLVKYLSSFMLFLFSLPSQAAESLLQAETAVQNGAPLSQYQHLAAHPLYPYLQYRHYRNHLQTLPSQEISDFLRLHPRAPFSGWLAEHAYPLWLARGDYAAILNSYSPAFADESIECEWRLANLRSGNRAQAQQGLEALWLSPKSIEAACDPLFAQLPPSAAQIEARFRLVMLEGELNLANRLRPHLQGNAASAADTWLAIRRGSLPLNSALSINEPQWRAAAVSDILRRYARERLHEVAAIAQQGMQAGVFTLEKEAAAKGLSRVAARLAQEDNPLAESIFAAIPQGLHDKNAVFDLIAYELRLQRWQQLIPLLSNMGGKSGAQAEVQYWLGKAYEKTGQADKARQHYQAAAAQRDFFGFLAAEKLGQAPQFNDKPLLRDSHYAHISAQPAAYRLKTFLRMGDMRRAQQEYNGLTYKMPPAELRQAALFAAEQGWVIQSVVSLVKTEDWDALNIRFPLQYEQKVRHLAQQNSISPATIFAIIRKESIFQPQIKSSAGAIGLMQVMPATARHVANQSGIAYRGSQQLTDIDTNLQLGSRYLADRLREFGHLAYAAAAYNAGPSRVNTWRARHPNLPLDEWIAQIPFYETRDYVKRVLEYERIYEYRLGIAHKPYRQQSLRPW